MDSNTDNYGGGCSELRKRDSITFMILRQYRYRWKRERKVVTVTVFVRHGCRNEEKGREISWNVFILLPGGWERTFLKHFTGFSFWPDEATGVLCSQAESRQLQRSSCTIRRKLLFLSNEPVLNFPFAKGKAPLPLRLRFVCNFTQESESAMQMPKLKSLVWQVIGQFYRNKTDESLPVLLAVKRTRHCTVLQV